VKQFVLTEVNDDLSISLCFAEKTRMDIEGHSQRGGGRADQLRI
jgi:hypothetical protein